MNFPASTRAVLLATLVALAGTFVALPGAAGGPPATDAADGGAGTVELDGFEPVGESIAHTAPARESDAAAGARAASTTAASFRVNYSVTPTVVLPGVPINITATVENTGGSSGTTEVRFYTSDDLANATSVTLAPGERTTVSYSFAFFSTGERSVRVNDLEPTTVAVGSQLLSLDSDQRLTISDGGNLDIWRQFIFPFRTAVSTAAIRATNRELFIRASQGTGSAHKPFVGIFDESQNITATFDTDRGLLIDASKFENVPAKVMVARWESPKELTVGSAASVLSDGADATFRSVESIVLDDTGVGEVSFKPESSGKYLAFLVAPRQNGSSLTISGGSFSVGGSMTIIGMDMFTVQEDESSVNPKTSATEPPAVIRGQNITFSVAADPFEGRTVEHFLLLYDNGTFRSQQSIIKLSGKIEPTAITNQTNYKSTIERVNGIRKVKDNITILGIDPNDQVVSRSLGMGGVLDLLTEGVGGKPPVAEFIGDTVLDASVTMLRGGASEEITVGTLSNFSTGTYRWIHVAEVANGTRSVSNTGTIHVGEGTQLSLSANVSHLQRGAPVAFTVRNEAGDPVNATVSIGGETRWTGPDGEVVYAPRSIGSLTVTAAKPGLYLDDSLTLPVRGVSGFSVTPANPEVGEQVSVTATIQNPGDTSRSVDLVLLRDGSAVTQRTATAEPGTSHVTLTTEFSTTGSHTVAVNGLSPIDLSVSKKQVTLNLVANRTTVPAGEPVQFTALRTDTREVVNATLQVGNETLATGTDGVLTYAFDDAGEVTVRTAVEDTATIDYHNDEVPITVLHPTANVSLAEYSVSDSTVRVDEAVHVYATVVNDGAEAGSIDLSLFVNGSAVRNRTVDVSANDEVVVAFQTSFQATGPRTIRVNGLPGTEVSVLRERVPLAIGANRTAVPAGEAIRFTVTRTDTDEPLNATLEVSGATLTTGPDGEVSHTFTDPGTVTVQATAPNTSTATFLAAERDVEVLQESANVSLSGYDVSDLRPEVDQGVTVTATVTNDGARAGSTNVTLYVDGAAVATRTVEVAANAEAHPEFTTTFSTTGIHTVTVGELSRTELKVEKKDVFLRLRANETTPPSGEPVQFTVTRTDTDEPVNATISFENETLVTGADGNVLYTFSGSPYLELRASARDTETIDFHDGVLDIDVLVPGSSVVLQDYHLSSTATTVGEEVVAWVGLGNDGTEAGTVELHLYADGSVVTNKTVEVPSNSGDRVGLRHRFSLPGTYAVRVNDLPTTNVTVSKREVQLDIQSNRTTVPTGAPVEFAVTRTDTGETVNATIDLGNETLVTGPDGTVVHTFADTGIVTARANARDTATVDFLADALDVEVASSTTIAVQGYTVSGLPASVGENVSVDVAVENFGTENESTTVTLYADGSVAATRSVTVAAESTRQIRFRTSFSTAGTHTVAVNDLSSTPLSISKRDVGLVLSANRTVLAAGEAARFDVTRADTGEAVNATIRVGSGGDATTIVAGADGTAVHRFQDDGVVTVRANATDTATVDFLADDLDIEVLSATANVSVRNYTVSPTAFTVEENASVEVGLENRGAQAGSITVTLYADGNATANRTVEVPANSFVTTTFETGFDAAGTHTVSVNDLAATSVSVSRVSVPLEIAVNRTNPVAGDTVGFTVTRTDTDEPVNATVDVAGATLVTGSDGTVARTFPVAGEFVATATAPRTPSVEFLADSTTIQVDRREIALGLSVNATAIADEEAVSFTVTRADDGSPVNATIDVAGQSLSTGADGQVVYRFHDPGTYGVQAWKPSTPSERYLSDGASIEVAPALEVTNVSLSLANGTTLEASFHVDERVSTIDARIVDGGDNEVATLTEAAFEETETASGFAYTATYTVDRTGAYKLVLHEAANGAGEDGAVGQADGLVLVAPNTTELAVPAITSDTRIEIDGRDDESVWNRSASYEFHFENGDGELSGGDGVDFRLFHDGEFLYVAIGPAWGNSYWTHARLQFDGDHDGTLAGTAGLPHTDLAVGMKAPLGANHYRTYRLLGSDTSVLTPTGLKRGSVSLEGDPVTGNGPVGYEFRVPLDALGSAPGEAVGVHFLTHAHWDDPDARYTWPIGSTDANLGPEDWATLRLNDTTNQPPTPRIDYTPATPLVGEAITFDAGNSTDPEHEIDRFEWDFDGDGTFEATGETVTRVFDTAGERAVTLRVIDNGSARNTTTVTVTVTEPDPLAVPFEERFDSNATGWTIGRPDGWSGAVGEGNWTAVSGGSVRLHVASSEAISLSRRVGDLRRGNAVTVAYDASGSGELSLELLTPGGDAIALDSATLSSGGTLEALVPRDLSAGTRLVVELAGEDATVHVRNVSVASPPDAPRPRFAWTPATPRVNATVTLNASASFDFEESISTYEWDVGADGSIDATGVEVQHAFEEYGTRAVVLRVEDAAGHTANRTRWVTVLPADGDDLVFADAFEREAIGSYPDGWRANGRNDSGAQRVVATDTPNGERAFRLEGKPAGCQGAVTNRDVDVPTNGSVTVSLWVKPTTDGEPGCHGDKNTKIKFRTSDRAWWYGQRRNLVTFHADGAVEGVTGSLGSYEPNTWHRVEITYRRSGDVVAFEYAIDGEHRGTSVVPAASFADDLSHLMIASGEYTTFVDDVLVATNATDPATVGDNEAPTAAFDVDPAIATAGEVVTFDATNATDSDGSISLYGWDFDADGTIDARGKTVTRRFTDVGNRTVRLVVADGDLASSSTERAVTVQRPSAIVPFAQTTPLDPGQARPEGLADDLAVQEGFATATAVTRLRNTAANVSMALEVTGGAENVTFYLARSTVLDSLVVETMDRVTMTLDGVEHSYTLQRESGRTWIAFNVAEFSNRTVSFTTDVNVAPRIDASAAVSVTNVGTSVSISVDASDPEGNLTAVTLNVPNGTSKSLLGSERAAFETTANVTFENARWNASAGRYEPREVVVTVRDGAGTTNTTTIPVTVRIAGDATGDGVVDVFDTVLVGRTWHAERGDPGYVAAADLDGDGRIGIVDAALLGQHWRDRVDALKA